MKVRTAIGLAALIAAALCVGYLDRQAVDADHNRYCEMVKNGSWPDYNKTYKAECGGDDPPSTWPDLQKEVKESAKKY